MLFRQAPARIAARVCGVDTTLALAMHEWITSTAPDKGERPVAFAEGSAPACFALVQIAVIKPAMFWAAIVAIPSLPVFLALRWF